MGLTKVAAGASGATNRARMAAAFDTIDQHEIDVAALQTGKAAAADMVAAQADLVVAESKIASLIGADFDRPGDSPALYTTTLTGPPENAAAYTGGTVQSVATLGRVLRVPGGISIGQILRYPVWPGVPLQIDALMRRSQVSGDVYDAVRVRVAQLDASFARVVGTDLILSESSPSLNADQAMTAVVSDTDGTGITLLSPLARYLTIYWELQNGATLNGLAHLRIRPLVEVPTAEQLAQIAAAAAAAASAAAQISALQSQVDTAISLASAGVKWTSATIEARSTGNINLATALENGDTLNGVTVTTGKHYFIGSQTNPVENGIYTAAASGAASRAVFADIASELAHIGFVIQGGTAGIGERWTLPLDAADITVNTTALQFAKIGLEPGYAPEVEAARGAFPQLQDRLDAGDEAAALATFRGNLWQALGDGDPVNLPIEVTTDGYILLSVDKIGSYNIDFASLDVFRANLWQALGDGDPVNVPIDVTTDGHVLLSVRPSTGAYSVSGTGSDGYGIAYAESNKLRVIDVDGDRIVNEDAGKLWLPGSVLFDGSARAAYVDGGSNRRLARVSVSTGNVYTDGRIIDVWLGLGQSNEEGRGGLTSVALKTDYDYPDRLIMPATPANNIWLGLRTSGGDSLEIDPDAITGFTRLRGETGDLVYGTTATETLLWRMARKAATECCGYLPYTMGWIGAEGGQTIANLLEDAAPGYYGFSNIVATMERVQELVEDGMPGYRLRLRGMTMAQGEANSTDAALGSKHDTLRSQVEAKARSIWDQRTHERAIMVSWQMCSFDTSSAGARSILTYARANRGAGLFFCGGPTYAYPFYVDFIHQASLGHQMRGSDCADIFSVIDRTGTWVGLEMVSFAVTGANEITVQLSEAATVDTSLAHVTAIANHGIALVGTTISSINVTGSTLVIATSGAASGVTAVRAAMNLQSGPLTLSNVPRTNIRSAASYGTRPDGSTFRKWLGPQELT